MRTDLRRESRESALPRLTEAFQILGRLQRPRGIAAVGWALGQLLMTAGNTGQGRQVLGDALAAAEKIGWTDQAQRISQNLDSPAGGNEER